MGAPELKSAEDVNAFAKETSEKVAAIQATIAEKDKTIADLGDQLKATAEKMKDFQVLIRDRLAIERDNTEEARLHKLGAFTNAMFNKDGKELSRLRAIPTITDGDNSFGVRKGFEKQYERQWNTKAALSTDPMSSDDTDSGNFYGSYLVPTDVIADVMRIAADSSAMMPLVTHRPVRGLTTTIPTSTDALTFTAQTNQETAFTEDTWTWGRSTLTVVTYATWIAITEAMDEDSLIGLGSFIRSACGEAWGTAFDTIALSNATYGAMKTSGVNQVAMGTGDTSFANLSVDYMDQLVGKLITKSKRRGARFFMSPSVWDYPENELDADGNYKIRRFSESAPLAAKGYPVVLSDGMPDTSDDAVSTDFVAFGNPAYIIAGDRVGFEFKIFDQTESSMKYGEIFLRARVRQAMVNTIPSAWSKLTTAGA
jgi:HK97 family phage major capsid protein